MGASAPSFGVPPVLGDSTRGRDALAAARRLIYFDVDESHQRTRDTIRLGFDSMALKRLDIVLAGAE